ncbi:MAG: hypothetical protein PUJ16_02160 [Campylobacteraceae bacterium]|nr:hypothetical protein [Campylobacteraceae bacterium]
MRGFENSVIARLEKPKQSRPKFRPKSLSLCVIPQLDWGISAFFLLRIRWLLHIRWLGLGGILGNSRILRDCFGRFAPSQ